MKIKLKTLIFLLVIITTKAFEEDEDEDIVAVVDEDYIKTEGLYPGALPEEESTGRSDRSNPQFRIMDILQISPAPNYTPQGSKDPFDFLRDSYPLPAGYKAPLAEYDYVIVGAGSAGSALASRLSEGKPRAMVLLIEAGKPEMITTDIPAIAPYFQRTDYATPYYMEHQPGVCAGMENQRCYWPRGRAVGGTSVINYMIYTRGRPQEWDRIAADGNHGWSYNDVLKYFIKSERADLPGLDQAYHRGRDGKVSVQFVPFRTPLADAFLEAGRLFGHPTVDYNDPDILGFGYVQSTTEQGHRHSAAKAYLHPHKKRKNLHILPYAQATKVLIDSNTKEAYGVEYIRNRLKYVVKARREVILSAGPIASPQLLMLSGIGPKTHLENLGIPVIQDLPVGQVLYDHITFPGVIFTLNTSDVAINEVAALNPSNFIQWLQFGDGVMTTIGGVEAIGYIKTGLSEDHEQIPDIEYISMGGSLVSDGKDGSGAIRKGMRITDDTYYSAFGDIDGTQTWTAFPMLLHPKSYGRIELKDSNPFSHPKLYGNYLMHGQDVATFIASIRHLIEIGESRPFQKFGARLYKPDYPTCRKYEFNTDSYWECAVRTLTSTLHHQIATCKMGPDTDKTAVVDPELRVYGVKRLRVVDTSVIPRTTSAHTNAPGMMIGEKAADLIKATWSNFY